MMQGINRLIAALAIAFTVVAVPTTSSATALLVGEPWGEFSFGEAGSFADACDEFICVPSSGLNSIFLESPPWTFTGPGFLIVQDVFNIGDQFRVFDDDAPIGVTSAPFGSGTCESDPVDCFQNFPGSSRRVFTLDTGDHSFTIQTSLSPFLSGVAYLCIDSGQGNCGVGPINGDREVTEPTSMLLLGLGLVGSLFWARCHRLNLKFGLQRAFAWRSSRQRKKLE